VILLGRLSLYGRGAERLHEELVPARGPLGRAVSAQGAARGLRAGGRGQDARAARALAQRTAPRRATRRGDPEEAPASGPPRHRGAPAAARAARRGAGGHSRSTSSRKRGEREEKDLRETLERQRERVREELAKYEGEFKQLTLDFDDDEKRQLESDMRSWRTRLEQFDRDLAQEPKRIRAFYEVRARRVEPVGLVYLWPESN
jgi:hypothetical protein